MSDKLKEIQTFLDSRPLPLKPFSEIALNFCSALSKELFEVEKITFYPDIAALAYWLRASHLSGLKERFDASKRPQEHLVPRGLTFHIAPANVETLFVYSWVLSLLAGNLNAIRLPSRDSPSKELIFKTITTLLKTPHFDEIAKRTLLLRYGHDDVITAYLSDHADVRMIWGGDATVKTIRKIPLKVEGKELVFVDRYAYAALRAVHWNKLNGEERSKVVQAIYNDTYYFEQQACSSTRALFWIGSKEEVEKARQTFYPLLQEIIGKKKLQFPTAFILKKQTHISALALSESLQKVQRTSNELTVIELNGLSPLLRDSCGGGLLFHVQLNSLDDLIPFASHQDQTLTTLGFSSDELFTLAQSLNGRGFDRIVPIGQALEFNAVWDGYDLLRELTRVVTIL